MLNKRDVPPNPELWPEGFTPEGRDTTTKTHGRRKSRAAAAAASEAFQDADGAGRSSALARFKGPAPLIPGLGSVALTDVNLRGCGLGPEGARMVCACLTSVGKLEILDLSDNFIYLAGALSVASMVTLTPTLRILRLERCRLQWGPAMVKQAQARTPKNTDSKAKSNPSGAPSSGCGPGGLKGAGRLEAFDPAGEFDPSALFVLADISKRLKQIEECVLTDEDDRSEPARQIKQSLAINRSLAYRRHVDLVAKLVAPFPKRPLHLHSNRSQYALTLDVDSKFLVREKLLHLRSVGLVLDAPPPPPLDKRTTAALTAMKAAGSEGGCEEEAGPHPEKPASSGRANTTDGATKKKKKKKGYFSAGLERLGAAAAEAAGFKDTLKGQAAPALSNGHQEGVFFDVAGGTDAYFLH